MLAVWLALLSEMGAVKVLARVPGLSVVGAQGQFLGDFRAQRIEWRLPRGGRLILVEPHWQGLGIAWSDAAPLHLAVSIRALQARSADLQWVADPTTKPTAAPDDLRLPLALKIDQLSLGRLSSNLWPAQPIEKLQMRLDLQKPDGLHAISLQGMSWQGWALNGETSLGSLPPLSVKAQWHGRSAKGLGDLTVNGTVPAPQIQGVVTVMPIQAPAAGAVGSAGAPQAQRLSVQASLLPFAAWPVHMAAVDVDRFDLQQLLPSLPMTALSGHVQVQPRAAAVVSGASDLRVDLDLRNERPGLWDAAALPVSALKGQLILPGQAQVADAFSMGRKGEMDVVLTLPAQGLDAAVGKVSAQGMWDLDQPAQTQVKALLNRVNLRALDSRSPPLQLKGQFELQGQADQTWDIHALLDGVVPRDAAGVPRTLQGQTASAQLQAMATATRVQVSTLKLSAGAAQAQASGVWQARAQGVGWESDLKLALQAFDPAMWMPWPRPAGDAVQRTRLDGDLQAKLSAPADAVGWVQAMLQAWRAAPPEAVLAQALKLQMSGQMRNSVLLGAPLQAQWQASIDGLWQAHLELQSGGNALKASVQLPLTPQGRLGEAQWQLGAQWPSLADWRAWFAPLGLSEVSGRLMGDAQGRVQPDGGWTGQGYLEGDGVKALRAGQALQLQKLNARWQFDGSQPSNAWLLDAQASQARWGNWQLPQASLTLKGPSSDQQIDLQAQAILPPRKRSDGSTAPEKVKLLLRAQAAWQGKGAAMAWSAKVQNLRVAPEAASAEPWLAVEPFEVQWQPLPSDKGASPASIQHQWRISPARATVFGAGLALTQGQWRQGPSGSDTSVALTLEPLKLADVLARFQPQVGWGGDMLVTGQLQAHQGSDGRWLLDAGIERQSGDLILREPGITGATEQRLGIRQAKATVHAANGVWTASQWVDARVLGALQADQRVVAQQGSEFLPSAADALSGHLILKVDNLRTASVWAPAGWRLGGSIASDLKFTGTLGRPGLQGQLQGQDLAVSNPLLGVQMAKGILSLRLTDQEARIERFTIQDSGGSGRLDITGYTRFGDDAKADLHLQATHFGLLQRVDRRAVVSGDLQVALNREFIKADGQLRVDEGLIDISQADAPTVGDDVNVVNRPGLQDDAAASPATARKVAINLALDLGQQLRLKGRGLDTRLAGQLKLSTPNGRSQVQGTIRAMDGTYAAYGQKLRIERGTLSFTGALDNPRLDIQAMRPQSPTAAASDVQVGVIINGTAQEPRVRLYSEPSMSETEKLSWLVLGRAPAGLNGADIGLLQTAAYALLDGEGPSVRDNLISTLGLDELSVRQTDGAVRDTIVSLGKQVSDRWYLGYERSLNATAGTWQAIYRLAQRFTLRVQSGDDNAIDLIWSRRWGE